MTILKKNSAKCTNFEVSSLGLELQISEFLVKSRSRFRRLQSRLHHCHTKLCFNINLSMYGLPSNLKSSSHKTWQTSVLFLKPLQIQNLRRKKVGGHDILSPPRLKKWGGHVPRVPHQIAPMPLCAKDTWCVLPEMVAFKGPLTLGIGYPSSLRSLFVIEIETHARKMGLERFC